MSIIVSPFSAVADFGHPTTLSPYPTWLVLATAPLPVPRGPVTTFRLGGQPPLHCPSQLTHLTQHLQLLFLESSLGFTFFLFFRSCNLDALLLPYHPLLRLTLPCHQIGSVVTPLSASTPRAYSDCIVLVTAIFTPLLPDRHCPPFFLSLARFYCIFPSTLISSPGHSFFSDIRSSMAVCHSPTF